VALVAAHDDRPHRRSQAPPEGRLTTARHPAGFLLEIDVIQFKRLSPDAKLPTRATPGSSGFDLYCTARVDLPPGQRMLLPTGIAAALPPGTCGQIWPRSGMATRQGIDRLAGLIDEDYRGEIHVSLVNHGLDVAEFRPGDRIAQLVVVPCLTEAQEVEELDDTQRGAGGFGSSGR